MASGYQALVLCYIVTASVNSTKKFTGEAEIRFGGLGTGFLLLLLLLFFFSAKANVDF